MKRNSERASALVYILIAVALFASLSYAVSQMMRQSAGNISEEKASVAASEIMDYGMTVRSAIQSMRVGSGCEDTEISFEHSPYDGSDTDYVNPNAPSDFSCHVFHPDGGGVKEMVLQDEWLDSSYAATTYYNEILYTGKNCIQGVGSASATCAGSGSSDEPLLMIIPYLKEDICFIMADRTDVLTPSGEIPVEAGYAWSSGDYFTGTYADGRLIINNSSGNGDGSLSLRGKLSACFERDAGGSGGYAFYQVLITR